MPEKSFHVLPWRGAPESGTRVSLPVFATNSCMDDPLQHRTRVRKAKVSRWQTESGRCHFSIIGKPQADMLLWTHGDTLLSQFHVALQEQNDAMILRLELQLFAIGLLGRTIWQNACHQLFD